MFMYLVYSSIYRIVYVNVYVYHDTFINCIVLFLQLHYQNEEEKLDLKKTE